MNLVTSIAKASESSDTWGAIPPTFTEYKLSQESIPIRIAYPSRLYDAEISRFFF
jgi:hypothetical protein